MASLVYAVVKRVGSHAPQQTRYPISSSARATPIKTNEPSVIRIASNKSRLTGMKGLLLLHSEPTLPLMKKLPRNRWEQQHGQNRGTDEH